MNPSFNTGQDLNPLPQTNIINPNNNSFIMGPEQLKNLHNEKNSLQEKNNFPYLVPGAKFDPLSPIDPFKIDRKIV